MGLERARGWAMRRAAVPRYAQRRCWPARRSGRGWATRRAAVPQHAQRRCGPALRVGRGRAPCRSAGHGPRAGQRCHSSRSVGGGQHSDGARPCAMSQRCKRMARGQPAPHQALPSPGCPLRRLALQRAGERKPRSRDTKSHSARRHCLFARCASRVRFSIPGFSFSRGHSWVSSPTCSRKFFHRRMLRKWLPRHPAKPQVKRLQRLLLPHPLRLRRLPLRLHLSPWATSRPSWTECPVPRA